MRHLTPELQKIFDMTDEERNDYLQQEVDKLINRCENPDTRRKLRGMQWQIDAMRQGKRYKDNPIGLCVEISRQMMQSLLILNQELNNLNNLGEKK